jgi:hypothetical protein
MGNDGNFFSPGEFSFMYPEVKNFPAGLRERRNVARDQENAQPIYL